MPESRKFCLTYLIGYAANKQVIKMPKKKTLPSLFDSLQVMP